jgi:hypothetical protein
MPSNAPQNAVQTNYQSNQDYDVDIKTLFEHYITGGATTGSNEPGENIGIDDLRAQISVSVTGMKTTDLITSLNINPNSTTAAPTPNTTTPVLLAQESRCHAFYRILGLPVVNASGSQYYNPGFDITKRYYKENDMTQNITLSDKITIASAVGTQFEALSGARETWVSSTTAIFNAQASVEAGVLSLTSGTFGGAGAINKRLFNVLQNVTGPTDFTVAHQQYAIATQTCVVGSQSQLLATFMDSGANTILVYSDGTSKTPSNIFFNHQHIIAPFAVDPRIDFSIWANESTTHPGTSRRIAVPFVPDNTYLQVSSTATAQRPIIESIIRARVYQSNQITQAGSTIATAQALIMSDPVIGKIPFIGSQPISNVFSGSVFNLSQQNSFADTLSSIQTMIDKLVAALNVIHGVQGIYYWLPSPNTSGPEGGCLIRDVPLNAAFSNTLITTEDYNIIQNNVQVLFSQPLIGTSASAGVPDVGNSAFSTPIQSFNKNTTDAQGSVSSKTQNMLGNKRNKKLGDAGNALQIIEMIMGEFSGFGLCDIIAIMGTLYTMDIDDLCGFLDDDAFSRAETILGSGFADPSSITEAQTALIAGVSGFYQIMDQVFIDKVGNGGLTTS